MRVRRFAVVVGLLCIACVRTSVNHPRRPVHSISELTESAKAELAGRRIFFGHQSVGANIMDGVADLIRVTPAPPLKVLDIEGPLPNSGGFFAHGSIGKNWQPAFKSDDFAARIQGGLGAPLDIAFHKYCYVDITAGTDVDTVFSHYSQTMARLRAVCPRVVFVHVTAPIVHVQSGLKAEVKKLIGRAPYGYADNVRREQFNERMRHGYAGREPVFDLAAVESTDPEGRPQTVTFKGTVVRTLSAPYTADGEHLNEVGRRRVAEELLVMLASLSSPK